MKGFNIEFRKTNKSAAISAIMVAVVGPLAVINIIKHKYKENNMQEKQHTQ